MTSKSTTVALKPHTISRQGTKLVLENKETGHQSYLDPKAEAVLRILTSPVSLRSLVLDLVAGEKRLTVRELFAILQTLERDGMIERSLGLTGEVGSSQDTRIPPFVLRPLVSFPLLNELKLAALPWIAGALAFALICGSLFYVYDMYRDLSLDGFLAFEASYSRAVGMFLVISSAILVLRGFVAALLTTLATGRMRRLRVDLLLCGAELDSDEIGLTALSQRRVTVLVSLAIALSPLLIGALVSLGLHYDSPYVATILILSIFFTLLSFHPARRSMLTLVLDTFVPREKSRNMAAYLKNRAVLSIATSRGQKLEGETGYLAFSSVALLWTVGGMLFSLLVLRDNVPALRTVIFETSVSFSERIGALLAFIAIAGSVFIFTGDLLSTLGKNIIFPLMTSFLKLGRKAGSKNIAQFDQTLINQELSKMSFFEQLSASAMKMVVERGQVKEYRKGTRLIIQGDQGAELFALLEGEVEVRKREATGLVSSICVLRSGSIFGEMALIKDIPRTADVVALTPIRAFILSKAVVGELLKGSEADHKRLLDQIALGHYLSSTALFRMLPAESIAMLREVGKLKRFKAGDDAVKQGEQAKSFYMIVRGWARVIRDDKEISALKQGDFFGEIGLLENVPRTATVQAAEELLVLELEYEPFWRVVADNPRLALALDNIAAERRGQ